MTIIDQFQAGAKIMSLVLVEGGVFITKCDEHILDVFRSRDAAVMEFRMQRAMHEEDAKCV